MKDSIKKALRDRRWWFLFPIPLFVIILNAFGPDGWSEPALRLLWLSWATVALAAAHLARKALHPYADAKRAWFRAIETSIGAGFAFLGLCILGAALFFGLVSLAKASEPVPEVTTYIPTNARPLLPMLAAVQRDYWPEMRYPSYFGALIEHESCVGLRNQRCWNSRAQLKTSREEGAGLGQFTRAWRQDGSLRFDALAEVRQLDKTGGLRDFTWATVYTRPDLSMRAILVKTKDCQTRLGRQASATPWNVLAFCDSAYNGGFGGLLTDRRMCQMAGAGCNPNVWFGNVEEHSAKSRTKWQGYGRSAFDINRHHVFDVLILRRPKYMPHLGTDK